MAVASIEALDNEQYTMQDTMGMELVSTGYQLGIFFLTHLTILVPGIVCK